MSDAIPWSLAALLLVACIVLGLMYSAEAQALSTSAGAFAAQADQNNGAYGIYGLQPCSVNAYNGFQPVSAGVSGTNQKIYSGSVSVHSGDSADDALVTWSLNFEYTASTSSVTWSGAQSATYTWSNTNASPNGTIVKGTLTLKDTSSYPALAGLGLTVNGDKTVTIIGAANTEAPYWSAMFANGLQMTKILPGNCM